MTLALRLPRLVIGHSLGIVAFGVGIIGLWLFRACVVLALVADWINAEE
jgi:hypothetical protein